MPEAPPAPLAMKDLITKAGLTDRAYLKDFAEKPLDEETAIAFLKKLDGAETLIGKRPNGIPAADAKPEEWDALFGKLRPEKADDYEIKVGEKPDEGFIKVLRESLHEGGIHKSQAQKMLAKLVPHFEERAKAQTAENDKVKAANEAREAAFETMLKAAVGPEYEKKSARAQAAIKELVPEAARQYADKIDDKSLVLLTSFVDALLSKYAKEDDFKSEGGAGGGGDSKDTLVKELHSIYANPAWKNFQHADHDKLLKREAEIMASPLLKA
jgi:hypothetical protein